MPQAISQSTVLQRKHLLLFSNLFAKCTKKSGFGTKGKFSSLLGGKFPRRDENINLPGYFFTFTQNNAKIDTFSQIT